MVAADLSARPGPKSYLTPQFGIAYTKTMPGKLWIYSENPLAHGCATKIKQCN